MFNRGISRSSVMMGTRSVRTVLPSMSMPEQFRLQVFRVCRGGHHPFDFRDRDRRQELAEQQVKGHENTEASEKHQSVVHRGTVIAPRARQEVSTQ